MDELSIAGATVPNEQAEWTSRQRQDWTMKLLDYAGVEVVAEAKGWLRLRSVDGDDTERAWVGSVSAADAFLAAHGEQLS